MQPSVVSYEDQAGFTLVSSSRKYYPILAYSTEGCFPEDYSGSGLEAWIDEQVEKIAYSESIEKTPDSFSRMWKAYEKNTVSFIDTKSDDLLSVRAAYIAQWEAQGYSWEPLSGCPDGLPVSVYNSWCAYAQGLANSRYDYLENSIIFYKRVMSDLYSCGPLTSTLWHQAHPFNSSMPLLSDGVTRAYVGCVTIALGQIMKYHQWPQSYQWNSMPDYTASVPLCAFLRDLYDEVIVYSDETGSSAYFNMFLPSILSNTFNYSASVNSHNTSVVKSAIDNGKPVFMSGKPSLLSTGHAWVCDGYNGHSYASNYVLAIISDVEPPLHYETIDNYTGATDSAEYYSMKWGYRNGEGNGWYMDNNYGNYNDYSSHRKNIVLTPGN